VFAQDEIHLAGSLELTLGAKLETNVYTGSEWLPNARLSWQPARDHLVWAAVSRAVRAPARIDRDLFLPGTRPFLLVANDTFASEIMRAAEIGYRAQVNSDVSFSLTAFRQEYPNLRSIDLSAAGPVFANTIEGTTTGVEGWGSWRIAPWWRLVGGFVWMDEDRNVIAGMRDLGGTAALGNDPGNTAMIRSSWDIGPKGELDLMVRHSGALPSPPVPAYTVLDARFGWRFMPNLDASVVVQNATDRHYAEWGAPNNRAALDRNVYLRITWKP
jgi:iron complex outermembrane receptor protein